MLDPDNRDPQQVEQLILSTAVAGNLYLLLTEKLLGLHPQLPELEE